MHISSLEIFLLISSDRIYVAVHKVRIWLKVPFGEICCDFLKLFLEIYAESIHFIYLNKFIYLKYIWDIYLLCVSIYIFKAFVVSGYAPVMPQ